MTSQIYTVAVAVTAPCLAVFLCVAFVGAHYACGTRGRYVTVSLRWAFIWPSLVYALLRCAGSVAALDPLLVFHAILLGTLLLHLWLLIRCDEDNFWRRKRRQLRKRLKSLRSAARRRLAGLGPQPAASPA